MEELNPGEVVGVNFLLPLASQNPYPIILVVYPVTKNRPNLSYFWENVKFTIPAVNIQGMVQIITTPAPQLCPLEAKNSNYMTGHEVYRISIFPFFKLVNCCTFSLAAMSKLWGKYQGLGLYVSCSKFINTM